MEESAAAAAALFFVAQFSLFVRGAARERDIICIFSANGGDFSSAFPFRSWHLRGMHNSLPFFLHFQPTNMIAAL